MKSGKKAKKAKKILTSSILIVIALVAAFGAGYYVGNILPQLGSAVNTSTESDFDLKLPGETEKMVVTVDEVKAKILEIGELTSCEGVYTVTKGEDFTRHVLDNIPIPGATNHIELTCTGIVKAGYSLEDIVVKVDEDSRKIYISLPDAKINSNQLLWDSSMLLKEQNSILNPIDFAQYQSLIADIKEEGLQEAEKNGLFDTVEKNAKNLITNFLGCFEGYDIVYM